MLNILANNHLTIGIHQSQIDAVIFARRLWNRPQQRRLNLVCKRLVMRVVGTEQEHFPGEVNTVRMCNSPNVLTLK